MADLRTIYMGIPLRNPLIVGASPLTANLESIKRIEEMGAGALVTYSLFEEQIQLERFEFDESLHREDCRNAEMITVFPKMEHGGPQEHLMWVRMAKKSARIPVIASLNAVNKETWFEYAKLLEETGVDGLECNLFASPKNVQQENITAESEQIELIKKLRQAVTIPVSVKLSFFYTNPLSLVRRMDEAGAAAFVLFNRLFDPDIDVNQEKNVSLLSLSHETDYRLPLRYTGLLEGTIKADICSSTGVFTGEDIARMILAGATAVQTVSALLRYGSAHIQTMLKQFEEWMDRRGYSTLASFRGKLSQRYSSEPWAYTRAQYVKLLMDPRGIMDKPLSRKD
ncbi:MAG: dihydroorotate dehydrogenase-like protein [Kiritimatiellae bacterium]|nr:dihydroorotate dehydrogenase-like protein [Kiritimatiellia bacterium]